MSAGISVEATTHEVVERGLGEYEPDRTIEQHCVDVIIAGVIFRTSATSASNARHIAMLTAAALGLGSLKVNEVKQS